MNQNERSKRQSAPVAVWIVSLAFWIAPLLTYMSAPVFRDQEQLLFAFVCLWVGRFACTLVHECGHAAAALACGWRIVLFVVRPIGIQVPNRNLAWIPRHFKTEAGGWVAAVPRTSNVGTRTNWSMILASGPIASLLLAIVAVLGPLLFPSMLDGRSIVVTRVGCGLALQSLHVCALTLMPTAGPDQRSDGEKLRMLARSDESWTRNESMAWLETLLSNNVRLRELPEWLVGEARCLASSSETRARYIASIDIGMTLDSPSVEPKRARALIEAYRTQYGTNGWLAACDAYLAAVWEDNAERGKLALSEMDESSGVPQLTLAAEAAVAARLGEPSLARSKLREMRNEVWRASPFRDLTFRDIQRRVEDLLA